MTNIIKNTPAENVHSHKEVLDFLKEHLKYGYVKEAKSRLAKKQLTYSSGSIRNIKSGIVEDWIVLNVLAEIALENKTAKRTVSNLISNH
ncbi:hypothetical protein [Maribacter sp. Hel_I_7]|uniref:hypothetical protein n=1 Tax=Maribacter sp. Hel_I_7 TaxID=1249997 RepID=UPI00047D2CF7|nr:hypothetical protein [Maribacter sp. Hel_I_7]